MKYLVMDEFHLSVLVPAKLPEAEYTRPWRRSSIVAVSSDGSVSGSVKFCSNTARFARCACACLANTLLICAISDAGLTRRPGQERAQAANRRPAFCKPKKSFRMRHHPMTWILV